ncbi:MAG: cytochrome c [Pseudomonadota bacterium]
MKRIFLGIFGLTLTIMVGLVACTQQKTEVVKAESPFRPLVTVQEVMASIVDPNIDPIWNSVSTVSTKEGTVDKQPQTDEEWKVLKNHALTLLEVPNLLVIEGRKAAADNASTSSHSSELTTAEVQKGIDTNRSDFNQHAHDLQDAIKQVIIAIDAKNPEELVKAGGKVDQVCEQCHKQFWYPNDVIPTS